MDKKTVTFWVSSCLTFVAILLMIDAASALTLDNQSWLLQLYPSISTWLAATSPTVYISTGALATVILWGITFYKAFDNPLQSAYVVKQKSNDNPTSQAHVFGTNSLEEKDSDPLGWAWELGTLAST